jgi:hypothetical protein
MSTYIILRNRIAREVSTITTAAATPYSAEIASAVLSAVQHYAREPFYFNTKTNTFNTAQDQEYYSSSDLADIATLVQIHTLTHTLSSIKTPLRPMPFADIDDAQTGSVTSAPKFFAYYKQNIRLYPIPDAVYVMTMAYAYKLAALSADGDSNAWTTDAEELIRCRAKADLYGHLLKEYDAADRMTMREQQIFSSLKRETRLRRSNNVLRVDAALVAPGAYNINTD